MDDDLEKRKVLSALCHGSIFFSSTFVSVGIPIAILFVTEDSIVKENAKESLNLHINLYVYAIVFALLIAVIIGIPLLIGLAVLSWIMPIIAIVKTISDPDTPYRYPFIFRLL